MGNERRCMYTTFCDDVRQEAGNKLSFMGIYHGVLYVPKFPTSLAKLCFVMSVRTPMEEAFKELKFRLLRDDELIAEATVDLGDTSRPVAVPESERWTTVQSVLQIAPMQISGPCFFEARADTESGEIRGGTLEVRQSAVNQSTAQPSTSQN